MTWHPRQLGPADRTHLRRDRRQQRHRPRNGPRASSGAAPTSCWRCATGQGRGPRRPLRAPARRASSSSTSPTSTRSRAARRTLLDRHDSLSALICNAGVMGGPFLLTRRASSGRWPPTTWVTPRWSRRCGRCCTERLAHRPGVEQRRRAAAAVAVHDAGPIAQPGAVRRQTGLPEYQAGKPAVRAGAAPPLREGRFAGQRRRRAPGASATNLFARQLERAGRDRLARVSKVVTSVLLPRPPPARGPRSGRSTPATPSGAFVGPARFGQFRGPPELLDVYASAKDPATAARCGAYRAGAGPARP